MHKDVADLTDAMLIAVATAGVVRLPGMAWALHGSGGALFAALLLVAAIFYVPSTALTGLTVGKLLFRLRVVPIDGGSVPGFARAVARFLLVFPSFLGRFRALLPGSWVETLDGARSRGSRTLVVTNQEWEALKRLTEGERTDILREALADLHDDESLARHLQSKTLP